MAEFDRSELAYQLDRTCRRILAPYAGHVIPIEALLEGICMFAGSILARIIDQGALAPEQCEALLTAVHANLDSTVTHCLEALQQYTAEDEDPEPDDDDADADADAQDPRLWN